VEESVYLYQVTRALNGAADALCNWAVDAYPPVTVDRRSG
jgi:hypothetical protein